MMASPFDPNDPFDLACEAVRGELLLAAARAMDSAPLMRLDDPSRRLEAMVSGASVAVACIALAHIDRNDPDTVDALRDIIVSHIGGWFDFVLTIKLPNTGRLN